MCCGTPLNFDGRRFGIGPEAFDAVDVALTPGELISAVLDPQMLLVADIHQPGWP